MHVLNVIIVILRLVARVNNLNRNVMFSGVNWISVDSKLLFICGNVDGNNT